MGDKLSTYDFKTAIDIQDACNLSGVVLAFAEVMRRINEEMRESGQGTDWRNSHPIAVLFASKIASLTRCEDILTFGDAYNKCKAEAEKVAKGEAQ